MPRRVGGSAGARGGTSVVAFPPPRGLDQASASEKFAGTSTPKDRFDELESFSVRRLALGQPCRDPSAVRRFPEQVTARVRAGGIGEPRPIGRSDRGSLTPSSDPIGQTRAWAKVIHQEPQLSHSLEVSIPGRQFFSLERLGSSLPPISDTIGFDVSHPGRVAQLQRQRGISFVEERIRLHRGSTGCSSVTGRSFAAHSRSTAALAP
jgi:hypothetical protein